MRRAWCVVVAVALATGCGSGGVLPVHGIVTLDGVPLDDAAVTFYPEEKSGTTGGTARTGTDGKFVVLGAKGQNGLVPGKYKVTVSKLKGGGGATDEPVLAAITEADHKEKGELPAKYSDPGQTTLSYSVTGDGQPIKIELYVKKK